jgi:hypothetical protein
MLRRAILSADFDRATVSQVEHTVPLFAEEGITSIAYMYVCVYVSMYVRASFNHSFIHPSILTCVPYMYPYEHITSNK